jgi:hypothetical protein
MAMFRKEGGEEPQAFMGLFSSLNPMKLLDRYV